VGNLHDQRCAIEVVGHATVGGAETVLPADPDVILSGPHAADRPFVAGRQATHVQFGSPNRNSRRRASRFAARAHRAGAGDAPAEIDDQLLLVGPRRYGLHHWQTSVTRGGSGGCAEVGLGLGSDWAQWCNAAIRVTAVSVDQIAIRHTSPAQYEVVAHTVQKFVQPSDGFVCHRRTLPGIGHAVAARGQDAQHQLREIAIAPGPRNISSSP